MYADLELLCSVYRPDSTFKYYIDIAPGEGGRERKWNYGIMRHEMVQRTCYTKFVLSHVCKYILDSHLYTFMYTWSICMHSIYS